MLLARIMLVFSIGPGGRQAWGNMSAAALRDFSGNGMGNDPIPIV